jgi:hypothetical protein
MTIGTILPEILAECGIDRPNAQISDNTFEMRQLTALMNAAGRDIITRAEWAKGTKEFIVAVPEQLTPDDPIIPQASAPLPADFQRIAGTGAVIVNGYDHRPARPVLSPEMWQLLEQHPSSQQFYQLREGRIHFLPLINQSGARVRYISSQWIEGKDGVTSNDDVPIFPEHLLTRSTIWRWKRQRGLPFDAYLADFEDDLALAIKADRGA